MTTGQSGLLEHGRCRHIRWGRKTVHGTTSRRQQREEAAELSAAADAAVDFAGTAVPVKELRAGRIRRLAMLEYTTASGQLDHATFRERADASVQCLGY